MNEIVKYTDSQIDLVKKTVCPPGTTDDELKLFLYQAHKTGLDPLTRQLYATKVGGKFNIQATIDGLRLIAQRTGEYAGQAGPEWADNEGKWTDLWVGEGLPFAARVGALRRGFEKPVWGVAKWSNYAPYHNGKLGFMWQKMPDLMLAKVAEALALRKAFPMELSGIYSAEEMDQTKITPAGGVIESLPANEQHRLLDLSTVCKEYLDQGDVESALKEMKDADLDADSKVALWATFDSKQRRAMKDYENESSN